MDGRDVTMDGRDVMMDGRDVTMDGRDVTMDGGDVAMDDRDVMAGSGHERCKVHDRLANPAMGPHVAARLF